MTEFYKGKKILITGSTGFKGSWLAFWLNNLGANVIGYSLEPNTKPSLFSILKLENKINQIYGDINNLKEFNGVVKKYNPEIIFHLAAQPIVRESYKDPIYTFQTNAIGTANIMECIRLNECIKGAVIITTDKVYDNKEWIHPYRENDRLGGFDPYSSSKAMAEIVVDSYKKSFLDKLGKRICTVRAGNVVGGGDWSTDRLVPDIVKTIMKDEKLTLRNPNATRPWQYVLEALYGYLIMGEKIFENEKYCTSYNFGPELSDTMKVEDLVKISIEILGKGKYDIDESLNNGMHEAGLLLLDNTKAKIMLNWKPKYKIKETLTRTLNWYKTYYNNGDIEKLSLEEINNFNN
ncbi:MAG: CDP-glucose 4,6-dehydratase [Candidatus Gracilibacteria bacterium]|nr:CDP-glucose 4,6-dehydratase [Candidatus Gracilibacteria bacterium]